MLTLTFPEVSLRSIYRCLMLLPKTVYFGICHCSSVSDPFLDADAAIELINQLLQLQVR